MNEWTNERMNEWTNERMNERTNERMNEWTNERMNEWTNERMNEWTNELMNEWINEFVKLKDPLDQGEEYCFKTSNPYQSIMDFCLRRVPSVRRGKAHFQFSSAPWNLLCPCYVYRKLCIYFIIKVLSLK
jgi:hypothetical protein